MSVENVNVFTATINISNVNNFGVTKIDGEIIEKTFLKFDDYEGIHYFSSVMKTLGSGLNFLSEDNYTTYVNISYSFGNIGTTRIYGINMSRDEVKKNIQTTYNNAKSNE